MEGWKEADGPPPTPVAEVIAATRDRLRAAHEERRLQQELPARGVASAAAENDRELVSAPEINDETVAALLENARLLAHDEEARGSSLKQRAAWLLGFQGVTVGIVFTQALNLAKGGFGSVGTPLAALLALVAVALLLHAAGYALKTLSVVPIWHVGEVEARGYPSYAFVSKDPTETRGEMLRGWVRQFDEERTVNNDKAAQLERSFRGLTRSLVVLAALILIVCAQVLGA